ncbi:uncharacterized protein LOC128957330 [Oppia nitens]|uniref:uncharacterized protein LOC128957330 n=1 Tax=Oppia nitens TaxID=1686743 RepID=UPI0023DAA73D|nr:uncharacterized protein LOC128957330 [Oppia nitens]
MKVTIIFGLILFVLLIFGGQGALIDKLNGKPKQQAPVIYERNDQAFKAHQLGNNNYKQTEGFKEFKYGNAYKTQQGFKDYQMKKHGDYEQVIKPTRKPYNGGDATIKLRLDKRYTSNDNPNALIDYRVPLTKGIGVFKVELDIHIRKLVKNNKVFIRELYLKGQNLNHRIPKIKTDKKNW